MPTVTLKVTPEERTQWQRAADRTCRGNLSEWLRQIAQERTSMLPVVRTHAEPERFAKPNVRPFRGMDTKDRPLH